MKKSGFYGMMLSAAVLLAACTDNDLFRLGEVPITLTTVVQGSDGGTRAATNLQSTQLGAGEEVYVTFSGGSSVVSLDHVAYTSDGNGAMTPATLPCFAFGGTSTTVNAYYGKSGGASGTQVTGATTSFSVAQDQSGDAAYKASDLMHATTTVEKSNPTGVLSLKHKMAKIIVNATLGEGVSSITGVYIIGGNRTIALSSDGACTLGATSDALSANSPLTMYTGSGVSVSCAALLPPQTITGDFLKVMTNRGAITFSLDNKSFATGKSYVYNLESNATSIGHTTDITDWDTSEDAIELVNNGTAALTVPYPPMSNAQATDVGKIICSNGHIHNTVSEADAAGCTASGIIAYVGDAGTADYSEGSGSYKGLALALYDYGGSLTTDGTQCPWYAGMGGTCVCQSSDVSIAIGSSGDWGKGIDNTNRLANAECGDGHVHAAAQAAKNFDVARPSGASQWFLPTMYQWNLMVKAMCGGSADLTESTNEDYKADPFNVKITAAGGRGVGNYYWSSVEIYEDDAWCMSFFSGFAGYGGFKFYFSGVRAVFAF